MKKFLIASCVALALPTAAFADVAAQLTVADQHAGFAAKATNIDQVHMHLHHVLNCLVGPGGTGFDAGQANPCAKAGSGAVPEADAAMKAKLTPAVAAATAGIAATDLAAAQGDATKAAAAIQAAK
jgi:hypothetical protein